MLETQELEAKGAALNALKERGRLSDTMIPGLREEITKIMDPLPPPWKWEGLRQLIELDAKAMGVVSGIPANRIRFWERGGGSSHPELWIDYAIALVNTVNERLQQDEADSLVTVDDRQIQDPTILALTESLRVATRTLGIWLSQGTSCDLRDLEQLWRSIKTAQADIRGQEILVRKRMRNERASQEGNKEGSA